MASLLEDPSAQLMLFAPTNAAWQAAALGLKATPERLRSDEALLQALVRFQVVPQRALTTRQWARDTKLPTLAQGQLLSVGVPAPGAPGYYVAGALGYPLAKVLQADIPACKALLFVTDGVAVSEGADKLLTARGLVGSG